MPAAGLLALSAGKEGCQASQPFLATTHQVLSGERIGEFTETLGSGAFEEGIGALLEPDAFLTHAVGEPVMLVETVRRLRLSEQNLRADKWNLCRG